jgi:hypothetical protein
LRELILSSTKYLAFGVKDTDVTNLIIVFFSLSLIYIMGAIILTIVPIIFLKQSKKERSHTTYELQLKLYKAILIQGWIIMFLSILPACLVLIVYWRKIPGSAIWVQLSFTLASLHGPVDLFVIGLE